MSISRPCRAPRTFAEAVRYFADSAKCERFVIAARWPDGITCPASDCGSRDVTTITTRGVWRCKVCRRQFSAKAGTVFEDSALGFDKWLPVLWLVGSATVTLSIGEVARMLGVPHRTAWFMLYRIRTAMHGPHR